MAYRAGIRTGDVIERINNTYASGLRLSEAQELIFKSKRQVRIYVSGDTEIEAATEYTVDFYYKPPFRFPPIHVVSDIWCEEWCNILFICHVRCHCRRIDGATITHGTIANGNNIGMRNQFLVLHLLLILLRCLVLQRIQLLYGAKQKRGESFLTWSTGERRTYHKHDEWVQL